MTSKMRIVRINPGTMVHYLSGRSGVYGFGRTLHLIRLAQTRGLELQKTFGKRLKPKFRARARIIQINAKERELLRRRAQLNPFTLLRGNLFSLGAKPVPRQLPALLAARNLRPRVGILARMTHARTRRVA